MSDLEQKVILKEFKALRGELLLRLNDQYRLTITGIVIFTAMLLLAATQQKEEISSTILLLAPLPFITIIWVQLHHNLFIAGLGRYIKDHIAPKLNFGWEAQMAHLRNRRHDILTTSSFFFLLIFAIIPIVAALQTAAPFTGTEKLLLTLDVLILIVTVWMRKSSMKQFKSSGE